MSGEADDLPDITGSTEGTASPDSVSVTVPEDSDMDPDDLQERLNNRTDASGIVASVRAASGRSAGDSTVTPVSSGVSFDVKDSNTALSDYEIRGLMDPQIRNIQDNTVRYNTRVANWIMSSDDLVPGIISRLKGLILGDDGVGVEPEDPDGDADVKMAKHLRKVYSNSPEVDLSVKPAEVVDRMLTENVQSSVWVGRSTDLDHIDVTTLRYAKSGDDGQEIYIQSPTGYTTFDINDDDEVNLTHEKTDSERALQIGKHVFDLRMFRSPPLKAVANDILNKIQLKRLKGRKAEIASIGAVVIKISPPDWLESGEYDDIVPADENPYASGPDDDIKKLELVYQQEMDNAIETLQNYQTATTMAIPDNWEIDTIDLPEMDESYDSMIRGYNQAISRRLLFPLDLLELSKGSELSRGSMMETLGSTISGWQGDIIEVFNDFARVQAEVHGMSGSVNHTLPSLSAEDEEQIIQLLNFAGILGLSEGETRTLANSLEGVDLDEDPDPEQTDMPPEGGPADDGSREQSIRERLDRQGSEPGEGSQTGQKNPEAGSQQTSTPGSTRELAASHVMAARQIDAPNIRELARNIRDRVERGTPGAKVATMTKVEPGVYRVMLKCQTGAIEQSIHVRDAGDDGFIVSGDTGFVAAEGAVPDAIEAASYGERDRVSYGDNQGGMVLEVIKSGGKHPEKDIDIEASSDNPLYYVARDSGGCGFYTEQELSSGSWPDDIPGSVTGDVEAIKAQFPSPDPNDGLSYEDYRMKVEAGEIEAANIPGVDDPEVGFRPGKPDGWTRISYLRAYASVGGSYDSCVTEMRGDVRTPHKWCAALKDEVYQTENWRGGLVSS